MRISDWSSDVCSSDLARLLVIMRPVPEAPALLVIDNQPGRNTPGPDPVVAIDQKRVRRIGGQGERKSVVEGKSVTVRVNLGGRRIFQKKKKQRHHVR